MNNNISSHRKIISKALPGFTLGLIPHDISLELKGKAHVVYAEV